MNRKLTQRLFKSMRNAQERISELTPGQKKTLEKSWDVEHAYYSSTLEGSKIDRKEFEKIGEKVK